MLGITEAEGVGGKAVANKKDPAGGVFTWCRHQVELAKFVHKEW